MNIKSNIALVIAAVSLVPLVSFGHAPKMGLDVTLDFHNPGQKGKICSDEYVIDVIVENVDANPITIVDLFGESVHKPKISKKRNSVVLVEEPMRISFSEEEISTNPILYPDEQIIFHATLSSPQTKGVFREVVKVEYQYFDTDFFDSDVLYDSEATLYYSAHNKCLKKIKSGAYDEQTDIKSKVKLRYKNKTLELEDVEGVDDVEPEFSLREAGAVKDDISQPKFTVTNENIAEYDDNPALHESRFSSAVSPVVMSTSVLNLEYCVKVRYRSNFSNIPSDRTGMKWWRPYSDDRKVPMLGLRVELWDRDNGDTSNDDFIGAYILYYSDIDNYTCLSYSWDGQARGETYPDPYLRTEFIVADPEHSSNTIRATLCASNQESSNWCSNRYGYTWRSSYYHDHTSGKIYEKKIFGDVSDSSNRRAMSIATVQKFLRSWNGYRMTGNLNVWWNGDRCSDTSGDPWPCSYDDNWFTMTHDGYRRWTTGPHEAGHCYQKQLFEQDRLYGTSCPSPHTVSGISNDSCAMREGWAEFVATKSWFVHSKDTAKPSYEGFTVETGTCHSSCEDNAKTEGQVLRTFWDIWDSRSDGLDTGSVTQYWSDIVRTWDNFPEGYGNTEDREGGDAGVNMRDFHHNSSSISSDMYSDVWTAMHQNDTNCQVWNP